MEPIIKPADDIGRPAKRTLVRKLKPEDKEAIIRAYREEKVSLISLAEKYSVTRAALYKVLRTYGVDTSKQAARVAVTCSGCGAPMFVLRCRYRDRAHFYHDRACLRIGLRQQKAEQNAAAQLQGPEALGSSPLSIESSMQRIKKAKEVISAYFDIQFGNVVHFTDGNNRNNHVHNLKVFRNKAEYLRHMRGFISPCIWDGSLETPLPAHESRNYSRLFPLLKSPYLESNPVIIY